MQIVRENGDSFGELIRIKCPRSKEFTISHLTEITAPHLWDRSYQPGFGTSMNRMLSSQINNETLKDLQAGLPNYSPREKQIKLLQNIERKTEYSGQRVKLTYLDDILLAWAAGDDEFFY
jgi:hypothetical protein